MLPLRKFTESEAQAREMAEDLSHFEPRRKHSRGYALVGQLLHQRTTRMFFPDTESRAQIATGGDPHDMLAH
jgi:hypothetical protein